MGNLRIKLKYKSFEIELEGEETTVQSEFNDIKKNGLGNVVNGVDIQENNYIIETTPRQLPSGEESNIEVSEINDSIQGIPPLKDVIMKQLPSSEREWILIYGYYSSEGGSKPFTAKNILECYENTKRKTPSRRANMSQNVKALFGKGYFSALNDDDYVLSDVGKQEALKILTRKNSSTLKQQKPSAKKESTSEVSKSGKKSVGAFKFEVLKDLNFRQTGKDSLIDFAKKFNIKSNADRIIVIIQYLNEILNIKPVTGNHIYSGFWELKCKIPTSFYQIITNTKVREKLLDFSKITEIKLSVQGENYIRFDLPNK